MLVELDPSHPTAVDPDGVRRDASGQIELRGGASRRLVYTGPGACLTSLDPAELLEEMRRRGIHPRLDPRGVSEFLHYGFVAMPRTVYRDVLRPGPGDRLTIGPGPTRVLESAWPWLNRNSRQDQEPSTGRLLELLVDAVSRRVGDAPATLMLSSGKDSVALALACREAGRTDVDCLTFASNDAGEAEDAARFARELGLAHRTVSLPTDSTAVEEALDHCLALAPEPCGDPTLVPYLLAVASIDPRPDACIVDGLNGDAWMGMPPSAAILRGSRLARSPLGWLRPIRGWFPPESTVAAALRDRAGWQFYGGRWLRHSETRRFYRDSVHTGGQWRALEDLDEFDFRTAVCGRDFELNGTTLKPLSAARAHGMRAVFPYEDEALAEYCFHLPEASRFDRTTLTNKVLLRQLLRERLDYDDARIGKRVFEFDGVGFLTRHREFVLHEIESCPAWNRNVGPFTRGLLDRPAALRKTWPSLLALFQLSGWIRRHPEETEAP